MGVWYRRELAEFGDNPCDPEGWTLVHEGLSEQFEEISDVNASPDDLAWQFRLRQADRDDAAALLVERGLPPDADTVKRLAHALFQAKVLAAKLLERRAEGGLEPRLQ